MVENSVLSGGVTIECGAVVKNSVIMEDVYISKNAKIYTSIIDSEASIGENAIIGNENSGKEGITVIANGRSVPSDSMICL